MTSGKSGVVKSPRASENWPLEPVACLEGGTDSVNCPRAATCPTIGFWQGLSKVVNEYVDSVTLADLMAQQAGYQQDYII